MDDLDRLDSEEVVAQHWPYDGPHTVERLIEALHALAALVRYANNATAQTGRLGDAPQMYEALAGLSSAAAGLSQLAEQCALQAREFADDPTLRHDEYRGQDNSEQRAQETAHGATNP